MRNASIDLEPAKARGVTVCGTPAFGNPTSGIAIGLMLELTRHIGYENARLKAGAPWQTTMGLDLEGLTLACSASAGSALRIAEIANAFGMNVIAWSQNLDAGKMQGGRRRYVGKRRSVPPSRFLPFTSIVTAHARPGRRDTKSR